MIVSCLLSKSLKEWGGNAKHEECAAPTSALQMPRGQRRVHSVSHCMHRGPRVHACEMVCDGQRGRRGDFCSRRWRRLIPTAAHLLWITHAGKQTGLLEEKQQSENPNIVQLELRHCLDGLEISNWLFSNGSSLVISCTEALQVCSVFGSKNVIVLKQNVLYANPTQKHSVFVDKIRLLKF